LVLPGISCSLVSSQLHLIEKLLNEFQAALQSHLGAGLGTPGLQDRSINLVQQPQRWPKVGNAMAAANVH